VRFIRKSAESLREMVNDLLDLAKIESGKFDVHVAEFDVSELFAALRGMFRPLLAKGGAELLIDDPAQPVRLETDQPKVAQVLRNFVSNALKFTEHGVVRVTVECEADGFARFDVVDSGIGIAAEHLEHIFEEFVQVDSAIQRRVKGTGLGLPLARRLATLLGGEVSVKSDLGAGSTFSLRIPMVCTSGTRSSDEDGEQQEAEPVKHA
jgi:signal transduction histidine kinase